MKIGSHLVRPRVADVFNGSSPTSKKPIVFCVSSDHPIP